MERHEIDIRVMGTAPNQTFRHVIVV
jgi:hypothetical protein